MDLFAFRALPDDARLWVMALDKPLEGPFREVFRSLVGEILEHWRHKGTAYEASWCLLDEQILLIAEPHLSHDPSGCAIDGMSRKVSQAAAKVGRRLLEERELLFREGSSLRVLAREELADRIAAAALDPQARLVDRSLYDLGALRAGRLERPVAETWIGRAFDLVPV